MDNQQTELLKSWVQVANDSDFTIYNLPFGVFRNKRLSPRIGVAIGDKIVDLRALQEAGFFNDIKLDDDVFSQDYLNSFIALGKATTKKVRERVQQLLHEDNVELKDHQSRGKIIIGMKEAEMMMPLKIGDCTSFVGRPKHLSIPKQSGPGIEGSRLIPIGSQRRVSAIIPSGTALYRPKGQMHTVDKAAYEFGSSRQLDFEMELAFVIGKPTRMGENVPVNNAEDYVFGIVMFNDWAARDIQDEADSILLQSSRSFASSISLWVLTLEAFEDFRTASTVQEHELMPYLQSKEGYGLDLQLEAYVQPEKGSKNLLCQTNFRHAHWSFQQLLAQQTINGSRIQIGDLLASGAVSVPEADQYSSMMELMQKGPVDLENGDSREFLKDGDTLIIKGYSEKEGIRVGFGEIVTKVLPSK